MSKTISTRIDDKDAEKLEKIAEFGKNNKNNL